MAGEGGNAEFVLLFEHAIVHVLASLGESWRGYVEGQRSPSVVTSDGRPTTTDGAFRRV
jgi:hypothetical protein